MGHCRLSGLTAEPSRLIMSQSTRSQDNIETIVRLEEEADNDRSPVARTSEIIGHFAGTIPFVIGEIVFVAVWITLNIGGIASVVPFDRYPFPLLSCLLSFECVMLTAFVLIRQNRMSFRADRRNHLGLQINVLAEKEITTVIQMLGRMSRQMGIEAEVTDSETREFAEDTSIETIARDLQDNLNPKASESRSP
jgi:uncharacterized membrane protein